MAEPDQDDTDALDGDHDGSYGEDGVRRPMNAFFIFCKRHRDVVREKYPHLENRSITKILGEWWANLDSSEKSSYTALAKQYKEAFMKAHPDFKWYKLPTPPTRTLITRPSNNRLQSKKEKILPKSSSCGIALGKLADEEHLGGLSALISPSTSDSSTASEISISSSSNPLPPTPSSNNMLKPPKKRYLVNGEFMCNSTPLTYDHRDDKTQNACSALLELAEICTSSVQHPSSTHKAPDTPSYKSLFDNLSNTTSTNALLCKSFITLKNLANTSSLSSHEQNIHTSSLRPHSEHLEKHLPTLSSGVFSIPDDYGQQLQDQPLNLCKTKSKTFTARNQQLIDHFVDKFFCDTPTCHSSPTKSVLLDPPISEFASSKLPNLTKNPSTHHGFTLSAAIESAIDQAYSKDAPVSPKQNKVEPEKPVLEKVEEEEEQTQVIFIDKIKKACLASSRKLTEKPAVNQYIPSTNDDKQKTESSDVVTESKNQPVMEPVTSTSSQNCTFVDDTKSSTISNFKREIKFSSSSKYYSKFASPPKKSRVWCNLFMKEQLKEEDGAADSSMDNKKSLVFDMNSPVRRNSQRTCKGRRYQALITEGLLQSTKERKAANASKKPLPTTTNDRIKTRHSSSIESPPVKTKKKKKDTSDKGRAVQKEDSPEREKNIFDLNEKIASLPKCSIEMLNKKKKAGQDGTLNSKSASVSSSKKSSKNGNSSDSKLDNASPQSPDNDSGPSSGRYKSGSFDLEQHIASLPKCDIEVLNKRRSKKE